jgi:predicted anti-sigma-YlaC factor YlaD
MSDDRRSLDPARCEQVRTDLSARLDGEDTSTAWDALDEHLAACPGCRTFLMEAERLHRVVRLRTAEDVPDLAPALLAAVPTHGYRMFARYALLTVSITILILAVPALLLGRDGQAPAHLARHLGAFDIALGVGLFISAWRPERARGFLPIAAALAGSMLVTAIIDASDGTTPLVGEAYHLLELAGLVLVWALAGFPFPRIDRRSLRFVG